MSIEAGMTESGQRDDREYVTSDRDLARLGRIQDS
jgi:hypothetical protein